VLELPPEQQLDTVTSRPAELWDGLRRSRDAMSKPGVEMQRQIEESGPALGQILGRWPESGRRGQARRRAACVRRWSMAGARRSMRG